MADQIRIYTKKAYQFKNADGETFSVPHSYIGPAPEWVKSNDLFKLALKSGNVEEVTSKADEKRAETGGTDSELEALRVRGKELGISRASQMGKDKLLAAIAEAEAKLEKPDLLADMDAAALRQFAESNGIDLSGITEDASADDLRAAIKTAPKG